LTDRDKLFSSPLSLELAISLTALKFKPNPVKLFTMVTVEKKRLFIPIPVAPSNTATILPLKRFNITCNICTPPKREVAVKMLLYDFLSDNYPLFVCMNFVDAPFNRKKFKIINTNNNGNLLIALEFCFVTR
jgi:hypothetical protein